MCTISEIWSQIKVFFFFAVLIMKAPYLPIFPESWKLAAKSEEQQGKFNNLNEETASVDGKEK